jgi:hypothetical protein
MNGDIGALKTYIKEQYSIANLQKLMNDIITYKEAISTNVLPQPEIDQAKALLIDTKNRLTNLMNNLDVRNFLIQLKDGSYFIINIDILLNLVRDNYISLPLVEKIEEQPLEPRDLDGNAVILNLIDITRNNLPIILNDICLTQRDLTLGIMLDDYLLNDNMLKTLILANINNYSGMVNFNISCVYKSITLSPIDISRTLERFLGQNDCTFMFVIKIHNKIIGWILEPLRKDTNIFENKTNVRLFFKIIDDVLYIYQPPASSHYYLSFNSDRLLSIVENKPGAIPLLTAYTNELMFNADPNFDNKTLDNNDEQHTTVLNKLQIYEIGGRIDNILQKVSEDGGVLRTFNYTTETIKQIYEQISGTKMPIDEKEVCRVRKYCPTYHPYLCNRASQFRNTYSTRFGIPQVKPSKGNKAPCVSDENICNMSYETAILLSGKSNISRTYSSEPVYCKTDERQMLDTTEGGKYRSSKLKIQKRSKNTKGMKIQKRSKNTKSIKIQKRSKNTKGIKIQKRSKKNHYF